MKSKYTWIGGGYDCYGLPIPRYKIYKKTTKENIQFLLCVIITSVGTLGVLFSLLYLLGIR